MEATHGVNGYRKGCRCDVCREANSEYMRQWRASKGPSVTQRAKANTIRLIRDNPTDLRGRQTNPEPPGPGLMEQAVLEETQKLSAAAERPASVANALAMARILDNRELISLHPTTSRQLASILNDLRGSSKKTAGTRLSAVKAMTNTGTR